MPLGICMQGTWGTCTPSSLLSTSSQETIDACIQHSFLLYDLTHAAWPYTASRAHANCNMLNVNNAHPVCNNAHGEEVHTPVTRLCLSKPGLLWAAKRCNEICDKARKSVVLTKPKGGYHKSACKQLNVRLTSFDTLDVISWLNFQQNRCD